MPYYLCDSDADHLVSAEHPLKRCPHVRHGHDCPGKMLPCDAAGRVKGGRPSPESPTLAAKD